MDFPVVPMEILVCIFLLESSVVQLLHQMVQLVLVWVSLSLRLGWVLELECQMPICPLQGSDFQGSV